MATVERTFTFAEFAAMSSELQPAARAATFDRLPLELQREAWANLREHFDHVSDRDLRDFCDDG
jgi:hypothetical protein